MLTTNQTLSNQTTSNLTDTTCYCHTCGGEFLFSAGEQAFFAEKGFLPPKNCKPCRDKRKAERANMGSPMKPSYPQVDLAPLSQETFRPSREPYSPARSFGPDKAPRGQNKQNKQFQNPRRSQRPPRDEYADVWAV